MGNQCFVLVQQSFHAFAFVSILTNTSVESKLDCVCVVHCYERQFKTSPIHVLRVASMLSDRLSYFVSFFFNTVVSYSSA